MVKYLTHLFIALVFSVFSISTLYAQNKYGNEWIDYSQTYHKIKVTATGLHRLDYAYLQSLGLVDVNPKQLQLFRRGKEVAVFVAGEEDGRLDAQDFLEFYGERNDGALDTELYRKPEHQLHQLYSLYTDTAAYFLTYSATGGKRMVQQNTAVGGRSPEPFFIQKSVLIDAGRYYLGKTYGENRHPWMDAGEGYASHSSRNPKNYTILNITNVVTTGPKPRLEYVTGASNNIIHEYGVNILQPSGGSRLLSRFRIDGDGFVKSNATLEFSDIASDRITVQTAPDAHPTTQNQISFAYGRVTFPQKTLFTGDQVIFFTDSTRTATPYFELQGAPATAVAYDITDPYNIVRIQGYTAGTNRGFVIGSGARTHKVLVANTAKPLMPAGQKKNVSFRAIDPAAHNYIIITNKLLLKPASGSETSAPEQYAAYRESGAGGGYKTLLLEMDQIVNQFHYGEFSSNSIRHLMQFLNTAPQPKHLFLLGKGLRYAGNDYQAIYGNRFSYYHIGGRHPKIHELDLVPTGISPSSDVFFTADFRNNSFTPATPTGRLAATSPQDIINYLNKVKEYEAVPEGLAWRKNILQLGGGTTPEEINSIGSYLTNLKEIAEGPLLGANVIEKYRQKVSDYVETVNVSEEVNNGLSLITFFGHSSTNTNDLDIGMVSSAVNGYNNKGKYPVILMNGCNSGDAFFPNQRSFGEDWLLTPDKGAISFIAHADMGYRNYLYIYSANFYAGAFQDPDLYGATVGQVQQEVIKRVNRATSANIAIAMVTEMVLQGDPAVKIYNPSKPDYLIQNNGVKLDGIDNDVVTADSEGFNLVVKVENLGKAIRDSVTVSVKRVLADNKVIQRAPFKVKPVFYKNEVIIPIDNRGVYAVGLNTFEIKLDSPDEFAEIDEANNSATLQYFFPVNGIFTLSPSEYGIVNSNNVTLSAQTTKLEEARNGYVFEVDTTHTFNSNVKKSFKVANGLLPSQNVDLGTLGNFADSTVYFWRARFNNYEAGEDTIWAVSSFRVINGTSKGWSQSHPGQLSGATTQKLEVETTKPYYNFLPLKTEIIIKTVGGDIRYTNPPYGIFLEGRQLFQASCSNPGASATPRLFMIVVNDKTLKMVERLGSGVACASYPYLYEFGDMNVAANRAKVEAFLKVIPNGYHVAVVSVNKVPFELFTTEQKDAFKTIGSALIDGLKTGYPFALVGKKGGAPGSAQEQTAIEDENQVPTSQSIALRVELASRQQAGEITSTVIGPALNWTSLHHTIRNYQGGKDDYKLSVIGIRMNGQQETRIEKVSARSIDLSGINAKEFPYLQLKAFISDSTERTAPQLKEWMVVFTEAPEGIIRPDLVSVNKQLLTEQARSGNIKVPMAFQNISTTDFPEKIKVQVTLTGEGIEPRTSNFEIDAITANSTAKFEHTMSTLDLSGDYRLRVYVNPQMQPEQHYFNNIYEVPFEVDRKLHPVLDVAFDGVHIMDGELVSPSPLISIVVRDQNKHVFLENPEGMYVKLINENGETTDVPLMGNPEVNYQPADAENDFKLDFKPAQLENGRYTLEVNAKDVRGKTAGVSPYRISFEVENESTITNFFPYPNPFSTKTQFVFTLTGATIPQDFKIQIMTVTGKVVKEIMMDEIGPIRVGNNKTATAWDGTDMYGDKLANGVYLYRVVMSQDAVDMRHKNKKADKGFSNGYGKLYILR